MGFFKCNLLKVKPFARDLYKFCQVKHLDLCFLGDVLTDFSMVNRHFSSPFGEYALLFPTTLSKSKNDDLFFPFEIQNRRGTATSPVPKLL